MFDENVISYKHLLIPRFRNGVGPGQADRTKMLTVMPSVSWQSFLRQLCAAHSIPLQKINIQCLSKIDVDAGHARWVRLASGDELQPELEQTDDADDSKDFLRITVSTFEPPGGVGGDSGSDEKNVPLTFDTTTQRKGELVKPDNADELDPDGMKPLRPLPTVVVQQPSRDDDGRGGCCSWLCSLFAAPAHGALDFELSQQVSKKRGKWLKGNAADEMEAISLLKVENHYLQQ